jgi:hypothetical protein
LSFANVNVLCIEGSATRARLEKTETKNIEKQESILPNFVFLRFPIFTVKLSHFVTYDKKTLTTKLPSLIAK